MSDSKKSYDEAFQDMVGFVDELYLSADADMGQKETSSDGVDVAPMFHELSRIKERYESFELLARGGMKEIYRVHDRRAVRDVALAKPVEQIQEDDYDSFLREAHLTARLEHPSIIKLFNMGIGDDGRPFFTMELKKGRTLRDILRSLRKGEDRDLFPLSRRLEILLRVCEAISYAHSRRVLHLDIKPENIQVGTFGEVQVCDWGMGVVIPRKDDPANDSEVLLDPDLYGPLLLHAQGTPGYMAPEQMRPREPKSEQMDIYALGCLLQELVTLQDPEKELGPKELPDPTLAAIISKARHAEPARRYSAVTEMHKDVFRYLSGYSTSVEHAGFMREAVLFYRRNRQPCRITLVLLSVIAAGSVLFVNQLRQSRNDAKAAQGRAEKALEDFLQEKAASEIRLQQDADLADSVVARVTRREFVDIDVLPLTVEQARIQVESVARENPPSDSRIWRRQFYLNFLIQDFDAAMAIVNKGRYVEHYGPLIPLAEKYAGGLQEKGVLPADKLVALFSDLNALQKEKWTSLIEQILVYDVAMGRPMPEQQAIARSLLLIMNPDAVDPSLDFSDDNRHVSISGTGVKSLRLAGTGRCYLRVFDPLAVSISSRAFTDLNELSGLRLYELDIRGTEVRNVLMLNEMRSLRRMVVSPGQMPPEKLRRLSKYIEVVVK